MLDRFKYALQGGRTILTKDRNFLYHLMTALVVFILGWVFSLSAIEWLFIILAIFLVIITEAINTAIEYAVDLATQDFHVLAKHAKDVAALSVLLASLFAFIVGCIIFIPKCVSIL
ncbi:diacylglycerol kinase family protein [Staphylococcus intermedius]|uniref:Diacylglycerol kinase n=1 Tax=Staphylococcus intermedius NCTC 11048 TaxID=1141106 RepID=A0A380G8P9_STAIN|nr:diacylglycerol kinase family protein [Staphylococcus intermedius]PCF64793.1 diacylglycerol kinase [Staphylococcus intermedius]PCF80403.1 diacylglycerol kinase [Staphylococcus intermedius]PCF81753.1 diacylglycerol kinase [Staphylococcus intermedius]PCF88090.1 diacylglycerol kinase [Staphylococcus intermedius]PCF88804.1 diacylglycerol kinase [Staphylococcus intermedius]